ncbi:U4/U6 small nuclear ribonucleoprotein prp4 [Mycoemilia scoparia]|uniref:non-specific serine/threonine protein kinase n=1 Tax=Mycoemilia scoparia TaxID=417184 RepID=A0A9W8A2A8_9FUNG|nr:U4/U6 small nuclear ribonucleoprotein prp4 [Mycoemilia scoparia]
MEEAKVRKDPFMRMFTHLGIKIRVAILAQAAALGGLIIYLTPGIAADIETVTIEEDETRDAVTTGVMVGILVDIGMVAQNVDYEETAPQDLIPEDHMIPRQKASNSRERKIYDDRSDDLKHASESSKYGSRSTEDKNDPGQEKQENESAFDIDFDEESDGISEEQKRIEESRRRRNAIMEKYKSKKLNPSTELSTPTVSTPAESVANKDSAVNTPLAQTPTSSDKSAFVLKKDTDNLGEAKSENKVNGMKRTDGGYVLAGDAADTKSLHATSKNNAVLSGIRKPINGTKYEDEDIDLFADNDDLVDIKIDAQTLASKIGVAVDEDLNAVVGKTKMVDSFDDEEGYYLVTPGEVLDGRYKITTHLGKGVFSTVVKARDSKNNNVDVAIKIIRNNETMYKAGMKELGILQRLQDADPHGKKHVVRLIGNFKHKGHLCLVFESLSMNLREVTKKHGRDTGLHIKAVRIYAQQLFLSLTLLEKCRVLHADIKPDNILASEQMNVLKLCDLGSASDVSDNDITPYLVSRFYRAPEIMLGLPYDTAIDTWSVGVTLFELYTGRIMFPGSSNNQMLKLIMEAKGRFPNRMIKRGQFWEQHFEDNGGGNISFISQAGEGANPVKINFTDKPIDSIKSRISAATPSSSSREEKQLVSELSDLIEKCLELNPERRLRPKQALLHKFFSPST